MSAAIPKGTCNFLIQHVFSSLPWENTSPTQLLVGRFQCLKITFCRGAYFHYVLHNLQWWISAQIKKLHFSILQKPMRNREDIMSPFIPQQVTFQNFQVSIPIYTEVPDKRGLFLSCMYICWNTNPRIRVDKSPLPTSTKTSNSKAITCKEVAKNTLRILIFSLFQSLYGNNKNIWKNFFLTEVLSAS